MDPIVWAQISESDRAFIIANGAIYVLLAVVTCPLHILVSMAVIRTGTVRKRITLRILLSLSAADMIQLAFQGIAGFSIIIMSPLNDTFNAVLGFIMNGLWAVTVVQHVTLALNRLRVVTSRTVSNEPEFRYFDSIIVISWIWGILFTCGYNVYGDNNLYFNAQKLDWALRSGQSTPVIEVLFVIRMVCLAAGLGASVVVMSTIVYQRRALTQSRSILTPKDVRLFAQTTVVFLLAITHIATWNLIADPGLYVLAWLNFEWVLVCTLMPYLNLAMSGEIRHAFLNVLHLKSSYLSSAKIQPITMIPSSIQKSQIIRTV